MELLVLQSCNVETAGFGPRVDCRASGTLAGEGERGTEVFWRFAANSIDFDCWDWFWFHSILLKPFFTEKTLASMKKSLGNPDGH